MGSPFFFLGAEFSIGEFRVQGSGVKESAFYAVCASKAADGGRPVRHRRKCGYIPDMDSSDGRAEWVARWTAAAPRLNAIRTDELRSVDVAAFIDSMRDAYEAVQAATPASNASGLVEQQRLFAMLPR